MPLYLTKFSYTPDPWARLIGNPEDRREADESVRGSCNTSEARFGGAASESAVVEPTASAAAMMAPARTARAAGRLGRLRMIGTHRLGRHGDVGCSLASR